ncbi:hypothetical protein F5Y13DRAFT_125176 [Hypoxylon sp. FL1857]|nr:hypothetical protein F5Y13DRAFT_125176 [Hypoxylon sp. FL1857]
MAPVLPTPASDGSSIGQILVRELEHIKPTRTLPAAITKVLAARQGTTTVVAQDNGNSSQTLSGGAIAGIVIGSIAGFLILLWIIRSCVNFRNPGAWGTTFEPDNEKPPSSHYHASTRYPRETHGHRSHSRHSHHSHRHHSPRRTSVVSITRPVYVEQPRGRSPRAPPAAYYSDRRSSDGRRYSRGY